jgi:hypothetical protein
MKVPVKQEPEPYTEDFTAAEGSLFDEDMEQIQVCDVKQATMETEFETFSELMREKESLLDKDLDKLDLGTKSQSLESKFEAYSVNQWSWKRGSRIFLKRWLIKSIGYNARVGYDARDGFSF